MNKDETNKNLLARLNIPPEEKHFREFFDHYYNRFFRIAIYYIGNEDHAQETVLDVFYTLWSKKEELEAISNFESYAFAMLKNAALNCFEKNNRYQNLPIENHHIASHSDTSPEENLLNDELLEIYVNALDELPPRCREVFVKIREQGMSYAAVAEELDISTKTVDAQLQKAVSRLREKINQYYLKNE